MPAPSRAGPSISAREMARGRSASSAHHRVLSANAAGAAASRPPYVAIFRQAFRLATTELFV